jgi:hypothetical protein
MIRAIVAFSSIMSALSFAPARMASRSASLKMGFEDAVGAQSPTGFWDPCSLSTSIDQKTFDYYRAAEIKHGRVCQLAILGYIIPEFYRFPGEIAPGIKFADIPNGVAAIQAVPALGWLQIFFLIGFIDFRLSTGKSAAPFAVEAGVKDFPDEESKVKAEAQEITHGRLAMLAILELLRHDSQDFVFGGSFDGLSTKLITGLPFLYNVADYNSYLLQ